MNTIDGIIEDLNKCELISKNAKLLKTLSLGQYEELTENEDICTTIGEIISLIEGLVETVKVLNRKEKEISIINTEDIQDDETAFNTLVSLNRIIKDLYTLTNLEFALTNPLNTTAYTKKLLKDVGFNQGFVYETIQKFELARVLVYGGNLVNWETVCDKLNDTIFEGENEL